MNDSYKNVSRISSLLGKIVIFLYTGKIIQVLDFNNWHPLNKIKKAQVRKLISALMVPALALLFHDIKFYVNSSSFSLENVTFGAANCFLPSLRLRRRRLTQYRIFASMSSLT